MVSVNIDGEKCIGCGDCKEVCPREVFEIEGKISKPVSEDACLMCLACVSVCDQEAISLSDTSSDMIL